MDQLPSAPPQVSFRDGLLTIVAQNSTLSDILREVHKRTGAAIDVPPNATERVATRIGPGPARDVLATLLNGTGFNYVMVGSISDPSRLTTVVLTSKPAGGQVANNQLGNNNVYQPPPQYTNPVAQMPMAPGTGPGGPVAAQPASDEEADAEEPDADENADEEQDQDQADTTGAGAQNVVQPNAGPKTPEQILEMLRNRQQQQAPGQVSPLQQVTPQMPPDQNEPQ